MSSKGIIPDPAYGGVTVTSLPAPSGVTNAYVPPTSFTVSTPLQFYAANCQANRFDPQQLNAFESEMLALAAVLAPNGTWNAGIVSNMANAFQSWAASFSGGISLTPSSGYPGADTSNTTAATPAYVTSAVAAAIGTGLTRAVAANYPDVADDTKVTTPAYVNAAVLGAVVNAAAYPSTNNTEGATPAYVTSAINGAIPGIIATVEESIPALAQASNYPGDAGDTAIAATPPYVAAAIGGQTIEQHADYQASGSPSNNQVLAYNGGASKWENTTLPFGVAIFAPGVMSNSENLFVFIVTTAFSLPATLTNSGFLSQVAATASTTLTIKKNGASVGTLVWAASGTVPTVTFASAESFAVGDILSIVGPATADSTLADISISLAGTRV